MRWEHIVGAQRYRYAGDYLVPIAHSEHFTQDDIWTAGHPPRVTYQVPARCPDCPVGTPDSLGWVVFVGADGRISDARPWSTAERDSSAVRATRAALAQWSFAPATLRDRPVADLLDVQVPITR